MLELLQFLLGLSQLLQKLFVASAVAVSASAETIVASTRTVTACAKAVVASAEAVFGVFG